MSAVAEPVMEGLQVEPDLARARELAERHNLIALRHSFIDDCETPVSALLKLRGEGPCFLLESAEQGQVGRWSFLGFRPRAVLRWTDGVLSEWRGEAALDGGPASELGAEARLRMGNEHA